MKSSKPSPHPSRREFFRQASCAALGTIGLQAIIRDLRLINAAVAQVGFADYKALVCLFLAGGNDANNMIIPLEAGANGYAGYSSARTTALAIPQASALPITPTNSVEHDYGFHPALSELVTLFGEGKLATVFNVGTLVRPLTRSQYLARSVPTPPQLFSHSDQVTHWQSGIPDQPPTTGWGGRIADRLHPLQYQLLGDGSPTVASAKISLCTSLAGANTFEVGSVFQQYHVSTAGAVTLGHFNPFVDMNNAGSNVSTTANLLRMQAVNDIIALPDVNLQRTAYAEVTDRAIAIGGDLNAAIGPYLDPVDSPASFTAQNGSAPWRWNTGLPYSAAGLTGYNYGGNTFTGGFPATTVGNQLRMIARMIAGRSSLQMQRQIFFVQVGGYDTHTGQVSVGGANLPADPGGTHYRLLNEVSECMFAFQRAMEQLGISDKVTTFTASDFGRTLKSNTQGSDHGWGSHHLVMGGAVSGQQTYGSFPALQYGGPDDAGTTEGRWIPRISVDEYSATIAKWFGVSATDMSAVFPNLGYFATPDLGFMA